MKPTVRPLRARRRARLSCAALLAAAVIAPMSVGVSSASAGDSHALIQGSGSSWAANAVNQWVADVLSQGLQVVYNPNGDASGRQDFASQTSDFSVTALGYQGVDSVTGINDTSEGRDYAYLPIAAGGTSFPYQVKLDGKQVENLRLSGETLAKIFTDSLGTKGTPTYMNWDNPEITADNDGKALPSLPIIPVVQSEGSGATAQLTRYFATVYPNIWRPYSGMSGLTEYYPQPPNGEPQSSENGSDGAMNFISSKEANGSIGYVEYSYALSQNYPVIKMLNTAGYYTLPTQYNVAVALEAAQINMNKNSSGYLLQNLDKTYVDPDPRTYPLSSYVYMIEPTGKYPSPESKITPQKRQTIADFTYYSICQGQKEIGPIGYSPLPVNLVEAGFGQLAKLKAADPSLDLTQRNVDTCDNPTFTEGHPNTNHLAQIAPEPLACDKIGHTPCAAGKTPNGTGPTPTSPPSPGSSGGQQKGSDPSTDPTTGPNGTSSTGPNATSTTGPNGTSTTGPTGTQTDPAIATDPNNAGGADAAVNVPSGLAGYRSNHLTAILAPLAVVLLILALALPPIIAYRISAKRRGGR
jgi:phosphate transport system substrate-binding protein